MRNMKKFLALALAATMTVTMVPATAFAASSRVIDTQLKGKTYTVGDKTVDYEDGIDATAKAVEDAGFSTDDAADAKFATKIQQAANKNGLSLLNIKVTVNPTVGVDEATGATKFPMVYVTADATGAGTYNDVADHKVVFSMTASKLTDEQKSYVVEMVANRAINNTLFTNQTSAADVEYAVNAGLAANEQTKDVKVKTVDYCSVNKGGASSGADGYVDATVTLNFKSVVPVPQYLSDNKTPETDAKGNPVEKYKLVDKDITINTIHGVGNIPLGDNKTAAEKVDHRTGKVLESGLSLTKNEMINSTKYAYARIPYSDFTVNASWKELTDYLATQDFYNDGFNETPNGTIEEAVVAALNKAGSPLLLQNGTWAAKVQFTTKKATHDADGSARVLVTVTEDGGHTSDRKAFTNWVSIPVDITIKHSPAEIKNEILTDVDTPVDASLIQAKNATSTPSTSEVKEILKKAIAEKLAKAPAGYTKPYSNDLDSSVPFEIIDKDTDGYKFSYTPSTFYKEGEVTYKVRYSLPKEEGKEKAFKGKVLKVTLPKLKRVCSTSIAVNDMTLRIGAVKDVDVLFSSADVTDKVVYITPAKNATTNVAELYYKDISGDYKPNYKQGTSTLSVNTVMSGSRWSDSWKIAAVGEGTTVFDVYYINAETGKTYQTSFKVTVKRGFVDVDNEGSFYYRAVYDLNSDGIIAGISDTEFAPGKNVTRAQFVSFLYRLALVRAHREPASLNYDEIANISGETPFADVKSDAYYAKAVAWAVKTGVTSGKSATAFDPNATVTRAEAVTFLYNYAGKGSVYNGTNDFADVPAGKFYTEAVNWAVANKITAGKSATMFAPKDPVTRGQAAVFVWNIKKNATKLATNGSGSLDSGNPLDGYTPWTR